MFIRVFLPLPFHHPFDYAVPEGLDLVQGAYVRVPFGKKECIGIVAEMVSEGSPHPHLKDILEVLPFPPLSPPSQTFIQWVARYTLTPIGLILNMVLGGKNLGLSKEEKPSLTPSLALKPFSLSVAQETVVQKILSCSESQNPLPFLLDGVTGSGKTEVYFKIIESVRTHGRQSLVLLPEISLSTQWVDRFADRFGSMPVVWHSSLTPAQRRQNWKHIVTGKAKVIVGARSALFLPYERLGLIVVDEEHDSSYKQEETVIYNARDMAVVRGKLDQIPVLLASATPSLESIENSRQGKYTLVTLPSRHGEATLPEIKLLDMRLHQKGSKAKPSASSTIGSSPQWISPPLLAELQHTFERGEQALLFLNRRGYAPLTLCGQCGEKMSCPYCTAWLVDHRQKGHLRCHHCGHMLLPVKKCPTCGAEETLKACGPGVERIAEEVRTFFPQGRYALVTSDHLPTSKALGEVITKFQHHDLDLLIGTQMLAKGFHFPHLTLVGVIDADLGLSGTDLRASERTYQLLHQVAGRAGRAQKPGRVFLQTYQPDHPLFKALCAHDREAFLCQERLLRERAGMPPYGRLAALIISSANSPHLEETLRHLSSKRPLGEGIEIWGPAPAPLALLRGKQRWRFLIKAPKNSKIQPMIEQWLGSIPVPKTVKIQTDIDPYSFL